MAAVNTISQPETMEASGHDTNATVAGRDWRLVLVVPGMAAILLLFFYPFVYGLILSFFPESGSNLANYVRFFSEPSLYQTIGKTLRLALPICIINVSLAVPFAFMLRKRSLGQRFLSTALIIPMTLGTVMVAEGMLHYLAPNGWLNRSLIELGIIDHPIGLIHNYWGVFLSQIVVDFPFAFMMMLSYTTGIDPSLARAAATLGASPFNQFRYIYLPLLIPGIAITFCLTFVLAFSIFPSAILLGEPAGSTRVISIAAYQAAFEDFDYSMASAIAMIMGAVQLIVVALILGLRNLAYKGPAAGGKG